MENTPTDYEFGITARQLVQKRAREVEAEEKNMVSLRIAQRRQWMRVIELRLRIFVEEKLVSRKMLTYKDAVLEFFDFEFQDAGALFNLANTKEFAWVSAQLAKRGFYTESRGITANNDISFHVRFYVAPNVEKS